MPARNYGPRTDLIISEEAAKELEFLMLIERAMQGDQSIPESDIVERLIHAKYEKTQEAFKAAMEKVEKEV